MKDTEKLRADKYLWAIRMFKTRSLATDACKAGKIKLVGANIKPSYEVKIGDVFQITKGIEKRLIKVTALLYNRGDYSLALQHYEDITPKEDSMTGTFFSPNLQRLRGAGRPTKKDRRDIDNLQNNLSIT